MTKTKTKKSRVVQLEDQNGTVSSNCYVCRDVLWGIVEHIKDMEHLMEGQQIEECQLNETIHSIDPELPFSFGSSKEGASKKRKREKHKAKALKKALIKPTTETLKTPAHDGKLIEHNVYILKAKVGEEETKEFVKVLGVGCNNTADNVNSNTQYTVVRSLNQEKTLNIPRTTEYLTCVPVNHYNQELYEQCEADLLWKLYLHKPENVHEKYWDQRYRIFTKYDEGILLDEESWYSITYESVAKHIVERYKSLCQSSKQQKVENEEDEENEKDDDHHHKNNRIKTVLDCFAGCGGMCIPLAMEYEKVIAVDWDKKKLEYLRHNSRIYGVQDEIEYVEKNVWTVLRELCNVQRLKTYFTKLQKLFSTSYDLVLHPVPELEDLMLSSQSQSTIPLVSKAESVEGDEEPIKQQQIDLIVLSPPWGGPEYMNVDQYDITTMLTCGDGYQLAVLAASVAKHIVYILPRNTTDAMLIELANIIGLPYTIEHIYLTGKFKLKIAYFGYKF